MSAQGSQQITGQVDRRSVYTPLNQQSQAANGQPNGNQPFTGAQQVGGQQVIVQQNQGVSQQSSGPPLQVAPGMNYQQQPQ